MKLSGEQLSDMLTNTGPVPAIAALYRDYGKDVTYRIRNVLWNKFGTKPEGHLEDVAQETWVAVTRALTKPVDEIGEIRDPLGWLTVIAIHCCYKYMFRNIRSSNQIGYETEEALENAVNTLRGHYTGNQPNQAERDYDLKQARKQLAECIENLPRTQFVVICLYKDDYKIADIASLLGMSEAAVRQNISRATRRLEQEAQKLYGGLK